MVNSDKTICENLYEAAAESDEALLDRLYEYGKTRERFEALRVFGAELATFYLGHPNEALAVYAEKADRAHQLASLKGKLNQMDSLEGVQILNSAGDRGAFFLPDASEPGRVRMTMFDKRGFSGHITRDSYDELTELVREYGFTEIDNDALMRFSAFESFSKGNEVTSLIARVNEGNLTHEEFLQYFKEEEEEMAEQALDPNT